MKKHVHRSIQGAAVSFALCAATYATEAQAQNSSLYQRDLPVSAGPGLKLANSSFYYQEPAPVKEIALNDIITVVVDEKSQVISEGELQRRKNSFYDASLDSWIELDGLSLKPAPQLDGSPAASGQLNSQYRTQAELDVSDKMSFRIAARVVDIRPNGNIVLEGHYQVEQNEEVWERSISGVARREDVLPNNTVFSEDISELRISKRERGSIFDGYRRGWLLRFYDRVQPF